MTEKHTYPRLPEDHISERFVRASGPGGQNVNKLATAVELRFDLENCPDLSPEVKHRLAKLAGRRLTLSGEIVIFADRFRTQERNREDARARLSELLSKARLAPKPRRATKPTLGSKKRRLEGKAMRGAVKRLRQSRPQDD